MTAIQDIAKMAKEMTSAGKTLHETAEKLLELGHEAGFVSIGEIMTDQRVVFDFHNGELIEFDGVAWLYRRAHG